MNRKEFIQKEPRSQVWFYFTSKMVTVIEERPGYDLSQFVADMGGSLGFLLGLSVLGLIGILEKVRNTLILTLRVSFKLLKINLNCVCIMPADAYDCLLIFYYRSLCLYCQDFQIKINPGLMMRKRIIIKIVKLQMALVIPQ